MEKIRREDRRKYLVGLLGGKCLNCGTLDDLCFDHIDPSTKLFNLGTCKNRNMKFLLEEVGKCQLLCRPCHGKKTARDNGWFTGHGITRYNEGCRCYVCKAAKNEYQKRYFKRFGRKKYYRKKV